MHAATGVNEPRIDANAIGGAKHAAFHLVLDAEVAGDARRRGAIALVRIDGVPRHHRELWKAAHRADDVLREPIGEIVARRVVAIGPQRKDRDRRLRASRSRRAIRREKVEHGEERGEGRHAGQHDARDLRPGSGRGRVRRGRRSNGPIRRDRGHRRFESIAATGNRTDVSRAVVPQGAPQLADALHERVVGHDEVRPHRGEELFLRDEPPGIPGEVAQHAERLGPKCDFAAVQEQAAAIQVQHVAVEFQSICLHEAAEITDCDLKSKSLIPRGNFPMQ